MEGDLGHRPRGHARTGERRRLGLRGVAITAVLGLTAVAQEPDPGVQLSKSAAGRTLRMRPLMEEALEAGAPGFALRSVSDYLDDAVEWYPFSSQEAMFAVVGDFNGDGAADVALDGQAGDEWLVVVVLSEESAYAVRVLEGGPIAVADVRRIAFLRLRLRGTELQCMEDGDIALPENLRVLESDAIELMVFAKAASAWYFEAGEFHSCVTAD